MFSLLIGGVFVAQIITPEFEALFKSFPLGSQIEVSDPMLLIRLHNLVGDCSWYLLGYDVGTKFALAYIVSAYGRDVSTVSIAVLESAVAEEIERDFNFKPCRLSQILKSS